jgi:hypothetical protein
MKLNKRSDFPLSLRYRSVIDPLSVRFRSVNGTSGFSEIFLPGPRHAAPDPISLNEGNGSPWACIGHHEGDMRRGHAEEG